MRSYTRVARFSGMVIVVGAVLLSTACGSAAKSATVASSTTTAVAPIVASDLDASKLPDPCRTVTQQQISAEFGATVDTAVSVATWPPMCKYVVRDSLAHVVYLVDDTSATAKAEFDRRRSGGAVSETIPGLGDDAYYLPELGAVHVMSGQTHVTVTVRNGGDKVSSDAKSHAVALAAIATPVAVRTAVFHA